MRFVGARLLHYPRLCVRTIEMVVGWEACKGVGVGSTEDERRRRGELLRRVNDIYQRAKTLNFVKRPTNNLNFVNNPEILNPKGDFHYTTIFV